jgi:acyl dehydratase
MPPRAGKASIYSAEMMSAMNVRKFKKIPKPYGSYAKIFMSGFKKNPYKILPQAEYGVDNMPINTKHLSAYNKVCGFVDNGILPPTYIGALSMPLQLALMTDEAFPFQVLGIVHINNTIEQKRPIKTDELVSIYSRFGEMTDHEKGKQFTFITTGKVNGELVWESVSVYLSRTKTNTTKSGAKPAEVQKPAASASDINQDWVVPENIGRQYGLVTGDINFIHLHAIPAKAFGFPHAIAHGMWTKARCLAALGTLPDAYLIDVQFKLPVFLPAKVHFHAQTADQVSHFDLSDVKTGKPHLAGTLTAQ